MYLRQMFPHLRKDYQQTQVPRVADADLDYRGAFSDLLPGVFSEIPLSLFPYNAIFNCSKELFARNNVIDDLQYGEILNLSAYYSLRNF